MKETCDEIKEQLENEFFTDEEFDAAINQLCDTAWFRSKRSIDFFNSMNNLLQSELIKSIQRNRFYTHNPESYLPYLQMYIFDQLVENNKQDKETNNKLDKLIKQNEELNQKFDKLIDLLSKE